jgi:hypothetical protein
MPASAPKISIKRFSAAWAALFCRLNLRLILRGERRGRQRA